MWTLEFHSDSTGRRWDSGVSGRMGVKWVYMKQLAQGRSNVAVMREEEASMVELGG